MALSVITTTDLFQRIAQADLEGIARLFTERKYPKGATIFDRGDRGEALYVVKEGLVKLASHSGRGTVTILHLLSTVHAFSMDFIRLLSRRLAKVEMEFAGFGHTWSYHRLAKVLLNLGAEHGVKTPRGTALILRITHEELANLIGTTRETVTTQQ